MTHLEAVVTLTKTKDLNDYLLPLVPVKTKESIKSVRKNKEYKLKVLKEIREITKKEKRITLDVSSDEEGDIPLARIVEALKEQSENRLENPNKFTTIITALLDKCDKPESALKDPNIM